ncbi:hypothetical protein Dret_2540 (plasmid) [Desulfohalobium retbaense DSM 5692]|uniref:Uncharacterized protein n=1 Tax=Desulfohalobium retbaense (strain ATCC 49708 / DSM 5692 / JCM 16813 / HR100) TaxID=485915 RepID=C8X5W9_DESRD|nr:hypothetical protein Dret_2540 [Desulfohalobium retbaense DSM 5692]
MIRYGLLTICYDSLRVVDGLLILANNILGLLYFFDQGFQKKK